MQQTPNYAFNRPELNDVPDITQLNPNWDTIDQVLKEAIDKANSAPPDSVSDDALGNRTPDQTQVPTAPGTGKLGQLVSWLANRIKAITGKTNWWDTPAKTIQQLSDDQAAHLADYSKHTTQVEKNTWNAKETPAGAQEKVDTLAVMISMGGMV